MASADFPAFSVVLRVFSGSLVILRVLGAALKVLAVFLSFYLLFMLFIMVATMIGISHDDFFPDNVDLL